jgi:hypothetical protein
VTYGQATADGSLGSNAFTENQYVTLYVVLYILQYITIIDGVRSFWFFNCTGTGTGGYDRTSCACGRSLYYYGYILIYYYIILSSSYYHDECALFTAGSRRRTVAFELGDRNPTRRERADERVLYIIARRIRICVCVCVYV